MEDSKKTKPKRKSRSKMERTVDAVAGMELDELKQFTAQLFNLNPTNARLIAGEKVELSLT